MSQENRIRQPLYVTALTLVSLLLVSLWEPRGVLGPFRLKRADIIADIRYHTPMVDKKEAVAARMESQQDMELSFSVEDLAKMDLSNVPVPIDDPLDEMGLFLKALKDRKTNDKIRIAYLGDSLIEGDLVSKDFRGKMQDIFGGKGVGFVPITSMVNKFRTTISHDFSDDWTTVTVLQKNPYPFPLGLPGSLFVPRTADSAGETKPGSWVEFGVTRDEHSPRDFDSIRLLYGYVQNPASVDLLLPGDRHVLRPLETGPGIRLMNFEDEKVASVRFTFSDQNSMAVYGAFLETRQGGVYVDNYSLRGASGIHLNHIPDETLTALKGPEGYKLVILQFGANIADAEMKSFSWYESGLVTVFQRLQRLFPEASILVIAASDKSIKREDGTYVTNPAIPMIVKAQRQAAQKAGVAFWNLYEAMGGENSMSIWVDKKLAAADYTHLTQGGARNVANLLTKAILSDFQKSLGKIR